MLVFIQQLLTDLKMEDAIERVDEMIRKNNAKYKDEQSQKAYEQALREYERQAKAEMAKKYAQLVKEGNRKAVQKAKIAQKIKQKPKKKLQPPPSDPEPQKRIEVPKKRMSEAEVNVVNQTIQARAEKIIQEKHIEKLSRKLEEEKKRNKLFELNEKCKKMLSKSHQRIATAKNIPEERMKVLKKLQDKAVGEIHQLDCIINNLIDKANGKAIQNDTYYAQSTKVISKKEEAFANEDHNQSFSSEPVPEEQQEQELKDQFDFVGDQFTNEAFNNLQNDFLSINTLIFQKSSEELLKMDYIPL